MAEHPQNMKLTRRNLIKVGVTTLALGAVGGVSWVASGPPQPEPGIASALAQLDRLEAGAPVTSRGVWSAAKIFHHLAQSVEMSVHGYPEPKSAVFQRTLGPAALAVFRKRGRMSHPLDDPIPGAPEPDDDGDITAAIHRLRAALFEFDQFTGPLAPHFAYGALTREQYAVAHALHLNNHLLEITTG